MCETEAHLALFISDNTHNIQLGEDLVIRFRIPGAHPFQQQSQDGSCQQVGGIDWSLVLQTKRYAGVNISKVF